MKQLFVQKYNKKLLITVLIQKSTRFHKKNTRKLRVNNIKLITKRW